MAQLGLTHEPRSPRPGAPGSADVHRARFQDVMFASRAFAIDCVSGFIRIGSGPDAAPEEPRRHPLVRALGPALETAFGIEHEALFPEAIRELVEALRSGPLGDAVVSRETRPAERCRELA